MRPVLQRQTSLPAKSLTTKSWVCPSGKRSSSIFVVLFFTLSVKRSSFASSLGLVTSKVVTIGALISESCFAVAIGFSSWEKDGAAANATDAAQSRGRMRRLSKVVSANLWVGGWAGLTLSEKPNLSTLGRTVNSEVTD